VNRRGIALLVVLMVIVLAGAVLTAVMGAVDLETRASQAAMTAAQTEAALFDLREDVVAGTVSRDSGDATPSVWRSTDGSTVLGATWDGGGTDSLLWLSLSARGLAVRSMTIVARVRADTGGMSYVGPLGRRGFLYPFF
jgi:Tfp pilus assembly protein PilX